MKQTPGQAEMVRMLRKVPLFSGLDEKEVRSVAEEGREVSFEAGTTIFKQGDVGVGFLLVLEGKVEVRKKGRVVATVGPGGFFGEMAIVDDKPRTADVVAVKATRCYGIEAWFFETLLKRHPKVAMGIIKELVRRLRQVEADPTEQA